MSGDHNIRRSPRARRLRIEVGPEGVEVVAPPQLQSAAIERFLEEKRDWIARALARRERADAAHPPPRIEDGGQVPYLGSRLSLRVREQPARHRAHVARSNGGLIVFLPPGGDAAAALEAWFRREARREIAGRLDAKGAGHTKLSIRNQRSRWASCSSSGAMSFNWRLLMAPEPVLDYVIDHEIVHLDVPDHSQRFWSALARRNPAYAQHERWLREYGSALRFP